MHETVALALIKAGITIGAGALKAGAIVYAANRLGRKIEGCGTSIQEWLQGTSSTRPPARPPRARDHPSAEATPEAATTSRPTSLPVGQEKLVEHLAIRILLIMEHVKDVKASAKKAR